MDEDDCAYCFTNDKWSNETKKHIEHVDWQEKDEVVMKMNLEKGFIKLEVNNQSKRDACLIKRGPEISCKMFVTLYSEGDQIELCKYEEK